VAPYTVNTIPENTLLAFADHGETGKALSENTASADKIIVQFRELSVNYLELAEQLQKEGAEAFNKSWHNLIESITTKRNQ
jgi:transaldolase